MSPRLTDPIELNKISINDSMTTTSESQRFQNNEVDVVEYNSGKSSSCINLRQADSKNGIISLNPSCRDVNAPRLETNESLREGIFGWSDNLLNSKEIYDSNNIGNKISPPISLSQNSSQSVDNNEKHSKLNSTGEISPSRTKIRDAAHELKQRSQTFFQREGMFNAQNIIRKQVERQSKIIIIPANHPLKISWDVLTVVLTFVSAYATHGSIRDRDYNMNRFVIFTQLWLLVDLLLNFFTQHKSSDGKVFRDPKLVWARYLTTWFAIDALSLIPWENLYVKPIIEMQNKRGFFKKSFFRTRAVIRVTRFLRGKHFRYFGKVVNRTQHLGVGAQRLLGLLIKYLPKYILFYKNMRGVLAVRTLRQIHMIRKVMKQVSLSPSLNETNSVSEEEEK